jgi:hypothetical protein
MTAMGMKHALMNQPIEVPALRDAVGSSAGVSGQYPQLLLRFGYGEEMPYSLRRTLSQVLISA